MDVAFLSNFNIVFGPYHWILTKIIGANLEVLATECDDLDFSCDLVIFDHD